MLACKWHLVISPRHDTCIVHCLLLSFHLLGSYFSFVFESMKVLPNAAKRLPRKGKLREVMFMVGCIFWCLSRRPSLKTKREGIQELPMPRPRAQARMGGPDPPARKTTVAPHVGKGSPRPCAPAARPTVFLCVPGTFLFDTTPIFTRYI